MNDDERDPLASILALGEPERLAAIRRLAASLTPPGLPTELRSVPGASSRSQVAIDGFARWLDGAFGPSGYPPELTGDLADLLDTIEGLYARLASFAVRQEPADPEGVRDQLFRVRIQIADDLPMILSDIVVSLDAIGAPE